MPRSRSKGRPTKPFFPPRPRGLVGRGAELTALSARLAAGIDRIALVGAGGSGKSMLACALGHRVRSRYPGGVHWFRVGAWDASTLLEMLARRLGIRMGGDLDRGEHVRQALLSRPPLLLVLDNHESDRALAKLLNRLQGTPATFVITARRCLLSGVEIYPIIAPLVSSSRSAFPRVASLTRLLRWHPLALDIADRLVATGAIAVSALRRYLVDSGVEAISVMSHEDDIAEVRLLIDWAWPRLSPSARAMLAALAHCEGDDIDAESLAALSRVRSAPGAAIEALARWHLVQEPLAGRYALHAVVRHMVLGRTRFSPQRHFEHYVRLLERHPERTNLEQTHLFAAMDHANRNSDLPGALRLERLLARLDPG